LVIYSIVYNKTGISYFLDFDGGVR
jgi:hypothetical protein